MGLILGKISVETPTYKLLHTSPDGYEVRLYPPSVVAEVTQPPTNRDSGFMVLANYIGAVGEPKNAKPEKIAMTAPVITTKEKMMFVLPSKYSNKGEAPEPLDGRVAVREEGERKYAAVRFSGTAGEEEVKERARRLRELVERDGYRVKGEVLLARYNPPWTLPPFRTNEILLPVH